MVKRVMPNFGLKPKNLAADAAYGSGKTLKALLDCNIEHYIPFWDKSQRTDGTFSKGDFKYDTKRDVYTCPHGNILKTTENTHDDIIRFRARTKD
jgi:hypothetical protein